MKRTLHLHIGAHRTATSSVQKYFWLNRARLPERGFLYPCGVQRHFDIINRIFSHGTATTVAEEIAREADGAAQPIHSVVISDEDICMRRDLAPLTGLSEQFDLHIVFMLRRQDLWLESWYQQNVKWQWNRDLAHLTFPEFLAQRDRFFWIDYEERVRHLESLFGVENVTCRVFEKDQMPDGPVAAFCEVVGLHDRTGMAPPPHINASLMPLMSEFMRNLPLDEMPMQQRRLFEQACVRANAHLKKSAGKQSALFLDAASRAALMQRFAPGNDRLARQRFGRDRLFLDPLPPVDAPMAPQRLPEDSYAVMRDLVQPFVRALAELRAAEIEAEKKKAAKAAGA